MNRHDYCDDLGHFVKDMPISSIFYARFDNHRGSVIDFEYPKQIFNSKEMTVSKTLLFNQNYGKVVTVKTHRIQPDGTRTNYKIVSCPELIRNTDIYKKMRNQFIYNIGLVLSWEGFEQIDEDQKPYYRSSPLVPLVKKMSEDLRALEIEYNYLSTQINPENESKYPSIEILCRKIFDDLTERGVVDYDPIPGLSYRIHLKVFPTKDVPIDVRLHHVPVLNEDIPDLGELTFQDLTASAIIPEIDGNRHVKRICGEKVSPELACRTIRDLVYAQICYVRYIFKFSNRYRVTPKINELYQDYLTEKRTGRFKRTSKVRKLMDHISLDQKGRKFPPRMIQTRDLNPVSTKLSFYDVFKFLSSLTPDYRIKDLVVMHGNVKKLCDVRKLCEYAEKEGWLARVHEYPALNAIQDEHGLKPIDSNNLRVGENILGTATPSNDTRNNGLPIQNQPSIRPLMDIHLENFEYVSSKYSLDEICACLELSEEELKRTFFDKVWPGQMEYYYQ